MAQRTLTVRLIGDDRSLRAATARSQGAMGKFAGFAKKAAKAGAAGILVGTAVSVKAFADFDKAMTESLAIMGDVSKKQRGEMVDAAREVGRTTRFSAREAAGAYFYLASAGLDAQQSLKAMPQVAAFAQAGNFDLATATDLVTDAQSALGLSSKKAGENLKNMTLTSDVLVKANTLANATVEQFSQSLTNKAGAAAKVLGKDIEETSAVLAAFADQGVKGELAGNALNIVWRDLQTAALKNKSAFAEQNVEVYNAKGEFRNTAAVMGDLEKALKGMSDEEKKATLTKLGFQDRSQAFILTLLGTSGKIREYERELRKAGGTTKTVSEKQLEGLTGAFTLLKSEVSDGALALGGALAPTLQNVAEWMRGFIVEVRTGTGAGGEFRQTVEGLASVLVPIGASIGGVALDVAGFAGNLLASRTGIVLMSAALGGLTGRLVFLGAAWAVGKVAAFTSAITSAVTMIRTAISITTSLRGAMILLGGSLFTLRGALLSTGIGAIAVLAGTAIGAILGMKAATDSEKISAEQLTGSIRSQIDAMRELADFDLDVAQRKATLAAANNAVSRAQQRVTQLERGGKRETLAYKEAVNALSQAKIQQRRAGRDLNRVESDRSQVLRKAREETRKLESTQQGRIKTLAEEKAAMIASIVVDGDSARKRRLLAEVNQRIVQTNLRVTDSQLRYTEEQLKSAEASGASEGKIRRLRGEIEQLRDKTGRGRQRLRELRNSINDLPGHKKVDVDVKINIPGLQGPVGAGGAKGFGHGWPLSEHVDSTVSERVRGFAQKNPLAALGAATGVAGLSGGMPGGVEGFTPMASAYGLSVTSGYRPGDDGYHGINRARDYADGAGPMLAFAKFMASVFGSNLRELIHSPLGFSVKDGHIVPPYAVPEHFDHVHVALQQGGIIPVPGTGTGDKVPAALPPGAFVMNRVAAAAAGMESGGLVRVLLEPGEQIVMPGEVARIGMDNLMHWNFAAHPRDGMRYGGPSAGKGDSVRERINRIWEAAAPYYHRSRHSKAPPTHVANLSGGTAGEHIDFEDGSHSVFIGTGYARRLARGDDYAEKVLLHEWAHYFQKLPEPYSKHKWMYEGGAEAFAAFFGSEIMRAAGLDHGRTSVGKGYLGYFRRVLRLPNAKQWTRNKQFGYRSGGPVDWGSLVGSHWDNDELATLAHVRGMSNPGRMAQKAQGESGGNPANVGDGGASIGLWQIHTGYHPEYPKSKLRDPWYNSGAAKAILASEGIGAFHAPFVGPVGHVDPDLAEKMRAALRGEEPRGRGRGEHRPRGPRAKPGRTRRGGGTEGPGGKRRRGEHDPRKSVSLPGLSGGSVPKVLQGLSPNITSLFKAPGMTRVERLRAAELALQESEDTADLSDDQAVLTYQLGAGRARKQTIQKELARLNKRLRGRLTKKQRKAIFAKRSSLVEELGEVQGQISGAREGLQGLGEGEFGEDPQTAAIERQTEAIEKAREVEEERIRLEEEHKQAIEALQKEMALNRKIAESEIATSGAVARRALADIIAGQLGPRAFHRAQTAGAGSVGGY